jgi:hypothetical protein
VINASDLTSWGINTHFINTTCLPTVPTLEDIQPISSGELHSHFFLNFNAAVDVTTSPANVTFLFNITCTLLISSFDLYMASDNSRLDTTNYEVISYGSLYTLTVMLRPGIYPGTYTYHYVNVMVNNILYSLETSDIVNIKFISFLIF